MKQGEKYLGQILIGLYGEDAPKTTKNFVELAKGYDFGSSKGGVKGYEGSKFHRVIPNFMIQGGDFTSGNGMGGMSIYGDKFADETFQFGHDEAGHYE